MQPEKFLEHFSTHLKHAIAESITLAATTGSSDVAPIHLLLALANEEGSMAREILRRSNVHSDNIEEFISRIPKTKISPARRKGVVTATLPELNPGSKEALERAMLTAYHESQNYIGTEHLLTGILAINDRGVNTLFSELNISVDTVRHDIEHTLKNSKAIGSIDEMQGIIDHVHDSGPKKSHKNATALDIFTVTLTRKDLQPTIDPVIGREKEIDHLMRILCRRTKNNPILVGEPGVGKTAIIEGLAKKIAEGDVPPLLKRKKVVSLDLPLLLSGTMYRGEFEARLKQLIEEISAKPDSILFIDEIHNIIGAGGNQGTMDAANILKPALARGTLHCIGATTIDEYEKYIENDPALERRFQAIQVGEPSRDETLTILQGLRPAYATYHELTIDDDALVAATDLSIRYLHKHHLPDKAIDLLDEAAAHVRLHTTKQDGDTKAENKLRDLLDTYEEKKTAAIGEDHLEDALGWRKKISEVEKKLRTLSKKQRIAPAPQTLHKADIVHILSQKLRVPKEYLLRDTWQHLNHVEETLKQMIVGQDNVIDTVVEALRHAHIGPRQTNRPHASFLFVGPSGVGKTALAKTLAQALYHDDRALILLNMTEFSEPHSISRLLGSPAGYVGYKERNRFTDELRKRPHSVLVFDEYDKAHPDVQKLLFQILDEGTLTESSGKKISFEHAIVILTTNIGADHYTTPRIGFGHEKGGEQTSSRQTTSAVHKTLREQFGSSLLSRIGHTLLFRSLTPEDMAKIIRNIFDAFNERMRKTDDLRITPDPITIETLARSIERPELGARDTVRTVEKILRTALLDIIQKQRRKKEYILREVEGRFRAMDH